MDILFNFLFFKIGHILNRFPPILLLVEVTFDPKQDLTPLHLNQSFCISILAHDNGSLHSKILSTKFN